MNDMRMDDLFEREEDERGSEKACILTEGLMDVSTATSKVGR